MVLSITSRLALAATLAMTMSGIQNASAHSSILISNTACQEDMPITPTSLYWHLKYQNDATVYAISAEGYVQALVPDAPPFKETTRLIVLGNGSSEEVLDQSSEKFTQNLREGFEGNSPASIFLETDYAGSIGKNGPSLRLTQEFPDATIMAIKGKIGIIGNNSENPEHWYIGAHAPFNLPEVADRMESLKANISQIWLERKLPNYPKGSTKEGCVEAMQSAFQAPEGNDFLRFIDTMFADFTSPEAKQGSASIAEYYAYMAGNLRTVCGPGLPYFSPHDQKHCATAVQ
ncbi:hypothetical protein SAMN04488518_11328 [Pseudovibrio ascidiaceicola]|uniref:Uncharacterized protein n=1 Tax=Pseudovibrio ascidiaceicola TaxID=285279 RepID=A0A1I4E084_9HYPH|nr:hypothetical protein [Pseudovibrio ascidiaceicola]SFK97937.1 hypothetical protein SAMN04488518_11328 [Pseudovibrio ascidiaceicola]